MPRTQTVLRPVALPLPAAPDTDSGGPAAADGALTSTERAHVLELLARSERDCLALIEPLTDAQWSSAPEGRWSVGQIVEHLGTVEANIMRLVHRMLASPPDPDWHTRTAGRDALLERILGDRTDRITAPKSTNPAGTDDRATLVGRLRDGRAQTVAFARDTTEPLKARTFAHLAPAIGVMNGYQWLLCIARHHDRHNDQIRELLASGGAGPR